jgi:hypothetical protein
VRIPTSILLALCLAGCSGGSGSPVQPGADDDPPPGPASPIDGTYSNLPRRPHVELVIESNGDWTARVWNPSADTSAGTPYMTCRDTLLALSPEMVFSGQGAVDSTARFVGFWQEASHPRLPHSATLQASYEPHFFTKDSTDVGPIIAGRYILSVGGACQATIEDRFWLRPEP